VFEIGGEVVNDCSDGHGGLRVVTFYVNLHKSNVPALTYHCLVEYNLLKYIAPVANLADVVPPSMPFICL